MKKLLCGLTILIALFGSTEARPVRIFSHSFVPEYTTLDNPETNQVGVIGEESLPFIVPDGCNLKIQSYGTQGYDKDGVVGLFVWIGAGPAANDAAITSVYARAGSFENSNTGYELPAGSQVNVRLINGQNRNSWISWYISGELIDPNPYDQIDCE